MQIIVKINIPEIIDPDSDEATNTINILQDELDDTLTVVGYDWWIDDVVVGTVE
jgi:hypothetical protein